MTGIDIDNTPCEGLSCQQLEAYVKKTFKNFFLIFLMFLKSIKNMCVFNSLFFNFVNGKHGLNIFELCLNSAFHRVPVYISVIIINDFTDIYFKQFYVKYDNNNDSYNSMTPQ